MCRETHLPYFNDYCSKHLPLDKFPLLVPLSLATSCKYTDPKIQSEFEPLQNFVDQYVAKSPASYPRFQNILFSPVTTSTQTVLERYYTKCEQSLIYFAAAMTEGRGRGANKWESRAGGLMFSYMSRGRMSDSVFLPYLDSLCLVKAIKPFIPDIMIKWPNDIFIGKKKVAGIICNASPHTSDDCSIVHGKQNHVRVCRDRDQLLEQGADDVSATALRQADNPQASAQLQRAAQLLSLPAERGRVRANSQGVPILLDVRVSLRIDNRDM